MRVGELSALRWDGITDKYIMIDKSEKYNRRTKEYYIDTTKNGKERIFPVTKEIKSRWKYNMDISVNGYLQIRTAGFMLQ